MTEDVEFDPEQGTISMWIKVGGLEDNFSLEGRDIITLSEDDGGLSITLEAGKILDVSFVYTGKGKAHFRHEFEQNGKYMVAVSWDMQDAEEVILYIDGEKVGTKEL